MASTFTLLLVGFILLDLARFGYPAMTNCHVADLIVEDRIATQQNMRENYGIDLFFHIKFAAGVPILCALNAWYMMVHVVFWGVFEKNILPVGKPWIEPKPASAEGKPARA